MIFSPIRGSYEGLCPLVPSMATEAATVLIVDDEPLNIDLLEQELGAAGYRTVSAASGEDAIVLAAKSETGLDAARRDDGRHRRLRDLQAAESERGDTHDSGHLSHGTYRHLR